MKVREVDGPYNILRLEGEVEGTQKIVYLFFDLHICPCCQSSCPDGQGVNIKDYIVQEVIKMDPQSGPLDFFMETIPSYQEYYDSNRRDHNTKQYITLLRYFFANLHRKRLEGLRSPLENLRVHYLDIRDRVNGAYTSMPKYREDLKNGQLTFSKIGSQAFQDSVSAFRKETQQMLSFLEGKALQEGGGQPERSDSSGVEHIIKKINGRYRHPAVRMALEPWFQKLKTMAESHIQVLLQLEEHGRRIAEILASNGKLFHPVKYSRVGYSTSIPQYVVDDMMTQANLLLHKDYKYSVYRPALLTDIYMMRRLLDKDEIRKGLVYSGGFHSQNYAEILVKGFGFRVTHAAFMNSPDFPTLNQTLLDAPREEYPIILEPIHPESNQCSHISGFPERFE